MRPRVALALGGGGARGFAHLGVLSVLEKKRIPVDLVVGTSMGAMVGALYCMYNRAHVARERIEEFVASPQFTSKRFKELAALAPGRSQDGGLFKSLERFYRAGLFFATTAMLPSYIDADRFSKDVNRIIPDARIEDALVSLAVVAADLVSGREVVFASGSLRTAVQASTAIAGVFPPVRVQGMELVDGGFVNMIPVETCFRLGADVVIAVDVSSDVSGDTDYPRTGQAIGARSTAILSESHKNLLLRFADVVVKPSVGGTHWAQFQDLKAIVPAGERAALEALPAIRSVLARARWLPLRRLLRGRTWRTDLEPALEAREAPFPRDNP